MLSAMLELEEKGIENKKEKNKNVHAPHNR
jgi:hypothetical protein